MQFNLYEMFLITMWGLIKTKNNVHHVGYVILISGIVDPNTTKVWID